MTKFQKKIQDRVQAKRTRVERERQEADSADERLRQKQALAVEFASKLLHEIAVPRLSVLASEMQLPEVELSAEPSGACSCRTVATDSGNWRSVMVRFEPAGQDLLVTVSYKTGAAPYENGRGKEIYGQMRLFDVEQMNNLHVAAWIEDELANCAAEMA